MAKKKKSKIQSFIIKFILITLLAAAISFAVGFGTIHVFRNNDYFKIRSVSLDSSLQFINKRDFRNLMGKNIFDIDLKAVQRRLSYKYPRASDLKIVKRFPNQIAVVAKQRFPFVQIQVDGKIIILDEKGVMLSEEEKVNKKLPLVVGVRLYRQKIVRGSMFKGTDVQIALEITKRFQAVKNLSRYSIVKIDTQNLSKILLTLSNDADVILDRNKIAQKTRILGVVLSQDQLDLKHVKYIDLRFKEPIIGKK